MPRITYVEHDGTTHTVEVAVGMNLMEGATLNMVPGIIGMCGGICSCATCHCYLPDSLQTAPPTEGEEAILGGLAQRRGNSRLGCQVPITEDMDGLVVRLPASQDTE